MKNLGPFELGHFFFFFFFFCKNCWIIHSISSKFSNCTSFDETVLNGGSAESFAKRENNSGSCSWFGKVPTESKVVGPAGKVWFESLHNSEGSLIHFSGCWRLMCSVKLSRLFEVCEQESHLCLFAWSPLCFASICRLQSGSKPNPFSAYSQDVTGHL